MPAIYVDDVVVSEGDKFVDVVVRLDVAAATAVTVAYGVEDFTANGNDFTRISGSLTFAPGETTRVVRVELRDDIGSTEFNERFQFQLSSPSNATLGGEGFAWIQVIDNDTVKDTPTLFVRDVIVDEKASTAKFVVSLGRTIGESSKSSVTVDYATADGSAQAGSDYVAKSGSLTFAPGESVKTVVVPLLDDSVAEGRESFVLNLSNATSATIADGQATAEIAANDATAISQPRLLVADMVVGEGDNFVDIEVGLSAPGSNTVTVQYGVEDFTANGNDFSRFNGKLTFLPGETSKVVRIELRDDLGSTEFNDRFQFVLSSPSNATLGGEGIAWIQVVDNDTVKDTPSLFVRDVIVDEKSGTAKFVVSLGRTVGEASNSTVTVDYATVDGSALAGSDYVAQSGRLSFAPGESVKTVVVPLIDDSLAEGRESFSLRLSSAGTATIADGEALAEIAANDAPAVAQPRLLVSDKVVGEGDNFVDVEVSLSAPGTNTITVQYGIEDFTANGNDYNRTSGKLTFLPGETSKVVRVELRDDFGNTEYNDRFLFKLSAPANATLGGEGAAWIQTVDNDTVRDTPDLYVRDTVVDEKAGTVSFIVSLGRALGEASNSTVTVDYTTVDGTATAGSDYVAQSGSLSFAPGETVKTVVVPLIDDSIAELRETFSLQLSNAGTASIADGLGIAQIAPNDAPAVSQPRLLVSDLVVGEGDNFVDVEVSLSAPGTNTITVQYGVDDFTANGNDYNRTSGKLTFLPGETSKLVRIEIRDDFGNTEYNDRFQFLLSAPSNATLGGEGIAWIQTIDNDTVRDTPDLFVRDVIVDEKAGLAKFVVSLGRALGEASNSVVTVDYATADGTASAGSDYVAQSGTLRFAPGETVKVVEVPLIDDSLAEGRERFTLNLSNAGTANIADGVALAEIAANDAAPVAQPRLLVSDKVVGEGDNFVDVEVSLSAPGSNTVTVQYGIEDYTGNGNDYNRTSGKLTFLPGETSKLVRVELRDDFGNTEYNDRFLFKLSAPANATLGGEGAAWIQTVDNDTVRDTPDLYVRDVIVDEKAGTANFVVSLGRVLGEASNSTVTVDYRTVDGTARAGSDYVGLSGTLSFAPGETSKTVVVDLIDDALTESAERFQLRLSNAGTATIADASASAEIGASDAIARGQPAISMTAANAVEGTGMAQVVLRLSEPSTSTVSVNYTTQNVTANGNDYYALSGTLRFAPGETTATVMIELRLDDTAESLETFRFNLSAASNATVPAASLTIGIIDDDTAGVQVFANGRGNDSYVVTNSQDVIAEAADGGVDTVLASLSYTLPDNVENLVLADVAALNGTGNALDNVFRGNSANNRFDGAAGTDTVVFAGPATAYSLLGNTAQRTVAGGGDGTDTLLSIERLQFSDKVLASDTLPGDHTWGAYAMLNAAFDTAPSAAMLGMWTAQYDQLGNLRDLAQAVINFYAPGVPNDVLVSYLWGTIVETPISPADLATFVGLLENGTFTQASLVEFVTTFELNTAEIVGIVGQTVTLDPSFFPVPG